MADNIDISPSHIAAQVVPPYDPDAVNFNLAASKNTGYAPYIVVLCVLVLILIVSRSVRRHRRVKYRNR